MYNVENTGNKTRVCRRESYLCIYDLQLPRARLWLIRCADERDEGGAEEHLDDAPCAVVWNNARIYVKIEIK